MECNEVLTFGDNETRRRKEENGAKLRQKILEKKQQKSKTSKLGLRTRNLKTAMNQTNSNNNNKREEMRKKLREKKASIIITARARIKEEGRRGLEKEEGMLKQKRRRMKHRRMMI